MDDFLLGWAKLGKSPHIDRFHRLIYHLLDVAACSTAVLETRPDLMERILVGSPPPRNARIVLPFLAAVHDLGKLSPSFQALKGRLPERIVDEWRSFPDCFPAFERAAMNKTACRPCHGMVSLRTIARMLETKGERPPTLLHLLSLSMAFHHDKQTRYDADETFVGLEIPFLTEEVEGDEPWERLRQRMAETVWRAIGGPGPSFREYSDAPR